MSSNLRGQRRAKHRSQQNNSNITEAADLAQVQADDLDRRDDSPSSTGLTDTKYSTEVLRLENNVTILDVSDLYMFDAVEPRLRSVFVTVTKSLSVAAEGEDPLILAKSKDFANVIHKLSKPVALVYERQWVGKMEQVWQFFQMEEHFSVGTGHSWLYDAQVENLIPGRKDLKLPKPDYAFGLKYNVHNSDEQFLAKVALNVKGFTEPAIDIVCAGDLVMPFLVGEAKSRDGSFLVAMRQMCNSFKRMTT